MNYVMVCHGGELELKAIMLTASLLQNGVDGREIIVAIPKHLFETVHSETITFFEENKVDILLFKNGYLEGKLKIESGDAISNKIYALINIDNQSDVLFLDSDILCRNKIVDIEIDDLKVFAKPADYSLNVNWDKVFTIAAVNYPTKKVVCTVDQKVTVPYFNSGVLFFKQEIFHELISQWKHFFEMFSSEDFMPRCLFDPFHRDQVAFSLAIQKMDIEVGLLDEVYNYPIRSRMNQSLSETVTFVHYHDIFTLAYKKELRDQVEKLSQSYPVIATVAGSYKNWNDLITGKLVPIIIQYYLKKCKKFIRNL